MSSIFLNSCWVTTLSCWQWIPQVRRSSIAALNDAMQHGWSRLEHDGVIQEFRIQSGAADIEQVDGRIEWLLDRATAVEILDDLAAPADHPGHQYVDIHTPTSTLVLSYDEYTPEYFAQLPDELRDAKPGES